MISLWPYIQPLLDSLPTLQPTKEFLNAAFAGLLGTGVGAWAGAWAAQRIAVRPKLRDELLSEIRNANAAINLAFLTVNLSLGLKGQHVKRMKECYDAKRAEFETINGKRREGKSPTGVQFELPADFETLTTLLVPVEPLQTIVLDKLSLHGRAHVLAPMLLQVVHSLNVSIVERNRLIEEFRANRREGDIAQLLSFYFGVRDAGGNIDNRFAASIEAIYRHTDDTIAFAHMLIKDLGAHGDELKEKFETLFREKGPAINKPDFAKAAERGLMPDETEYADWNGMFVRRTIVITPSRMRWLGRRYLAPLSVRCRRVVRPVIRRASGKLEKSKKPAA
jgi:hypothetical protein